MCGIWAFFPMGKRLVEFDFELVEQIMTLTSLRGKDSTGIACVADPKGRPKLLKAVGGPDWMTQHESFEKFKEMAVKRGMMLFGHGRSATKGEVNVKNAHPFTVDHITLVHNGTIDSGLAEEMKILNTDNDSHALCYAIAKQGLVEALAKINGAYACIIHDAKEGCIYTVRNDLRPLHKIEFSGNVVIMSEEMALEYLADRNPGTYYGKNQAKVYYFPKYLIYKTDLETGETTIEKELESRKSFTPPPKPAIQHGMTTWQGGGTHKKSSDGPVTVYLNDKVTVFCTNITHGSGNTWMYDFTDNDGNDYFASCHQKLDKLGEVGYIRAYSLAKGTKHTFKYLKWADIVWDKDIQQQTPAEKEGDSGSHKFRNGAIIGTKALRAKLSKQDCGICGGVVQEREIADTILTSDGGLICADCIRAGKHHAYGFEQ